MKISNLHTQERMKRLPVATTNCYLNNRAQWRASIAIAYIFIYEFTFQQTLAALIMGTDEIKVFSVIRR